MRQWTQKEKQTLAERVTAEVENNLREEVAAAHPLKEAFTGAFSEE